MIAGARRIVGPSCGRGRCCIRRLRARLAQGTFADVETARHRFDVLIAFDRVAHLVDDGHGFARDIALGRELRSDAFARQVDLEVDPALRAREEQSERFGALFEDKLIGINTARQGDDAHRKPLFDQHVDAARGRGLAGGVAVEAEVEFVGDAPQLARLFWRECGAEACDCVLEAGLMQRDRVEVAFDHDERVVGARRAARQVQRVDVRAFGIRRGVRRVEVLGRFVAERAPAERHDLAGKIVDRQHEPVTEEIVVPGLLAQQSGAFGQRHVDAGALQRFGQTFPAFGCVADTEDSARSRR